MMASVQSVVVYVYAARRNDMNRRGKNIAVGEEKCVQLSQLRPVIFDKLSCKKEKTIAIYDIFVYNEAIP